MKTSFAQVHRAAACLALALLLTASYAPIAFAHDEAGSAAPTGISAEVLVQMFDLTADKLEQLAEAFPEETYAWRPAEGVRSVSESFMHAAEADYHLASALGAEMPGDLPAAMEEVSDKAAVVAAVVAANSHARTALQSVRGQDLEAKATLFGQEMPKGAWALGLLTHNAEHLGQLIAYARSNGVVPPWSQPQASGEGGEGSADGGEMDGGKMKGHSHDGDEG